MIAGDLYTFLAAKSSIRAIVAMSGNSPTKPSFYTHMLPLKHYGYPALTYALDEDSDQQLLSGISGLKEALLTVDCWALVYSQAHSLAAAVKAEMVGYRGAFGSSTAEHIRKERELDLHEPDTKLFRVSLQFRVAYT